MAQKEISNLSIKDLTRGYSKVKNSYKCNFCNQSFSKGIIYTNDNQQMNAKKSIETHITNVHGSAFSGLLTLDKNLSGLTDVQKQVLGEFYTDKSDAEIVKSLGLGSQSTVRNHRFALKEKFKQAKIFCSLMTLLEEKNNTENFVNFHRDLPIADDRTITTEKEESAILKKCFSSEDPLILYKFPKKEKDKLIILKKIALLFTIERKYSEAEVNAIIEKIYGDFATIRRYLIEYKFLNRKNDCSEYWKNLD